MHKRVIIFLAIAAIFLALAFYWWSRPDYQTSDLPAVSYIEIIEDTEDSATIEIDEVEPDETAPVLSAIKPEINLAVPFTSQAPESNWDLPYQELCEEASAYMVAEYYFGKPEGKIDAIEANTALLEAIAFEEDYLGTYLDTTAEETASFIEAYYGLEAEVLQNPTVEQIKAEVAAGRPVIVPAAGRELGNPNFTGEGPLYHMLVIKGYTADSFITNDPGTRNGENYVYNIATIMAAMGDWNDGSPATGAKVVIFVSKP